MERRACTHVAARFDLLERVLDAVRVVLVEALDRALVYQRIEVLDFAAFGHAACRHVRRCCCRESSLVPRLRAWPSPALPLCWVDERSARTPQNREQEVRSRASRKLVSLQRFVHTGNDKSEFSQLRDPRVDRLRTRGVKRTGGCTSCSVLKESAAPLSATSRPPLRPVRRCSQSTTRTDATCSRYVLHDRPTVSASPSPYSALLCVPLGLLVRTTGCFVRWAGCTSARRAPHRLVSGVLPRRTICRRQEPRWQGHEQCQTSDRPRSGALRVAHPGCRKTPRQLAARHAHRVAA